MRQDGTGRRTKVYRIEAEEKKLEKVKMLAMQNYRSPWCIKKGK